MFITRGTYGTTVFIHDPEKMKTITFYILTLAIHFGANGIAVAGMTWVIESVADMRIQMLIQLEDVIVFLEKQRLADEEVFVQASILLGQIYRQPMTFTLCNVFHLNYSLVQSLVSLSVTYTIILAQINLAS